MRHRVPSFLAWSLGLGLAGLGDGDLLVYNPAGAWGGALLALLLFVLWGERTRPKPNGLWVLLGIVWAAGFLVPSQPAHAFVAGTAVALLWLHDAPGAPSAMLGWGLFALVWQGDPSIWQDAGEDQAFYVATGMTLVVLGAQLERERLARQRYAPVGFTWNTARISVVAVVTLVLLAGRETLGAASLFAALGLDITGTGGKVAMLGVLLVSLGVAATLFRVRPARVRVKTPSKALFDAPAPARGGGGRSEEQAEVAERVAKVTGTTPAPKQREGGKGPMQPGEIDFD